MPIPTSPTRLLSCDACRASLPYEPEQAGSKCRCGSCGKILTIPSDNDPQHRAPGPEYVSFACPLCQSNLSARIEHVGKKAKCPDCDTISVVPPPPKVKKKKPPRAMHGQQYGLWGVDEAPLPAELAAKQPKLFPVYCDLCNTLMQAQVKQVGSKLKCPDCGSKTRVPEPPPEQPVTTVLVPDGQEYQLDESAAPGPRPVPVPPALIEGQKQDEYRDRLQAEYGDRPKLPRLPTLQGVWPMLLRPPLPTWWLGLSCALTAALMLGLSVLGSGGGGFEAIMALCFFAMGCIIGCFWFSASAALGCCVLTDSSEGNNKLFNQPASAPQEWIGETLFVAIALAASAIPGWAVGAILAGQGIGFPGLPVQGLATGVGMLLSFPVLLLSTLETGSPIEIFSPRILKSLIRRPFHWLLLYIQTAIIAGACLWLATLWVPDSLYLFCPSAMAASLLYFRLLGRFAWWLAESMPAE